jgi:long-chain acyl-CoA synthetase
MLTHENLLWNAFYASQCADFGPHEVFLSFLPLSHTLERTGGYYLPMLIGAEVAYARSIAQLAQDLQDIRPTVLISVPRIYERVYGRIQDGLAKKGPLAACCSSWRCGSAGGASNVEQGRALAPRAAAVAAARQAGGGQRHGKTGRAAEAGDFRRRRAVARHRPRLHRPRRADHPGLRLTETSPVVCVNRPDSNVPSSIGRRCPASR